MHRRSGLPSGGHLDTVLVPGGLDGYVLCCIISGLGNSEKVHQIRCDLKRRL